MSVLALRHWIECEPPYTVRVPAAGARWLTSNDRGGWQVHATQIQRWRDHGGLAALSAKIPPLRRAYALAELRFKLNRRRDPANWYPTVKAVVDGLVDVGVLRDDSSEHLIGPDLRIGGASPTGGALLLHLWEIGDG